MIDIFTIYNLIVVTLLIILLIIAVINVVHFASVSIDIPLKHQPFVSVLIPARNEEKTIYECVEGLCNQSYSNYEVIVLNDSSTDGTVALLDALAITYPSKLTVIQGGELPKGWMGKSYACHLLSKKAKGEYLLFTDADTKHEYKSIESLIATTQKYDADLLSGIPLQLMNTFWEKAIIPIIHLLYFAYLPNKLIHTSQTVSLSAANGQLILFKKKMYDTILGHESVKNNIVEDIYLAKNVKKAGGKVVLANAILIVSCKMYNNAKEVFQGFSKNLYPGLGYNPFLLVLFIAHLLILYVVPVAITLYAMIFNHSIELFSLLHLSIAFIIRSIITYKFNMPLDQIFYQPAAAFGTSLIAINSFIWTIRKEGQMWKDRYYTHSS